MTLSSRDVSSSFLSVLMKFPKLPWRVRYIKREPSPSRLLIDYKRLVLFPRKFAREERLNVSSDRPGAGSMKGRKTGEGWDKNSIPFNALLSAACLSVFSNEHGIPVNGNEWLFAESAYFFGFLLWIFVTSIVHLSSPLLSVVSV